MAKLALVVAAVALLAGVALAKEPPTAKYSCKKPSIPFKAKLLGKVKSGTKQYPVGTFEVCLAQGKKTNPSITTKQNVQGVNNYNGYLLSAVTGKKDDFADIIFADASNNTTSGNNTSTGLTVLQCNPTTDLFQCKYSSVSISGWTTTPISRDGEEANLALQAFVLALCNKLTSPPKGVPKTATLATIAILADGSTTGYPAAYFTTPKKNECTV
jgi:hypothetical protein